MFENNVPKKFWSDAVQTATYLINRLPCVLKNKSLMEIICQNKPNINHLRVFECVCFVHQEKGYKCYDPKKIKNFIFLEM
jgi:hypothetical protein